MQVMTVQTAWWDLWCWSHWHLPSEPCLRSLNASWQYFQLLSEFFKVQIIPIHVCHQFEFISCLSLCRAHQALIKMSLSALVTEMDGCSDRFSTSLSRSFTALRNSWWYRSLASSYLVGSPSRKRRGFFLYLGSFGSSLLSHTPPNVKM